MTLIDFLRNLDWLLGLFLFPVFTTFRPGSLAKEPVERGPEAALLVPFGLVKFFCASSEQTGQFVLAINFWQLASASSARSH